MNWLKWVASGIQRKLIAKALERDNSSGDRQVAPHAAVAQGISFITSWAEVGFSGTRTC